LSKFCQAIFRYFLKFFESFFAVAVSTALPSLTFYIYYITLWEKCQLILGGFLKKNNFFSIFLGQIGARTTARAPHKTKRAPPGSLCL
jgi:hypothetical protein